ncbi:DNA translocase FtsK [Azospira inquinata]|uniref:DNA translocase FtsK 4TM domain-containing protein n=1 Tax=Azospira inquinata TaxID=2785627 RepID=A0A975SL51_9RHOO|nr:DNA translocase FtsK [Azospira inquinata]QWT46322.1 DNA translocase FtsK 4TM domain-containing protein [Azospira inquinata]QWT48351.1 DNA translocase FtsK 4TM domain-containing protein [Azospira inquinata]
MPNSPRSGRDRSPSPLPEKIALILQESRWLGLVAVALFLAMALWGYDRGDPGWSHSAQTGALHNPVGRFGAWLADLLLYVFGLSAWWWIGLLLALVWWGYRRLDGLRTADNRPLYIAGGGFLVLLLASSGLEALRFYTLRTPLPLSPGGMLGLELSGAAIRYLGYTGATLFLLALVLLGWSLFSGMSWLGFFERLGGWLETVFFLGRNQVERWQDQRIGREVAREREAVVQVEKTRVAEQEPVRIERVEPEIPVSPKAEKRIERERQTPLFPEAVEGGQLPPLYLLDPPPAHPEVPAAETLEFTSRLIERKLADFGVQVKVLAAYPGPVVTRYEIEPATGVKGSQIVNLSRDLARALAMVSIRVVETVPGKSCMALELPNPKRQTVRLSEILSSKVYHDTASPLTVTLGKDIGGLPVVADLAKMPHLLVAGTTGSGKSVGINAMILSLLYKAEPKDVRLILVDPKMLELSIYEGIPHLLAPVVTDMRQAANALSWCVGEMDKRYKLMSALGVRNLAGYNAKLREAEKAGQKIPNPFSITPESPEPLAPLPFIVVIIDELADMMMVVGKKVEELIARLAQKARASGIHLVLATQRPSVDVITGLIKANIPTRIAFQVSSKIDSRTILDQMGAEALLGQGDMLYLAPGTGYPTRVHGAFVADDEVHKVVDYLKTTGAPEYEENVLTGSGDEEGGDGEGGEDGDGEKDPMYDQAVEIVLQTRRASISLVQRNLRIGYNRASRLIEAMEKAGLVSPMDGRGGREVLARKSEE